MSKTATKELVDGINDVTNSDYHADRKYLSSSVLKTIYKSLDQYYLEYKMGMKKEVSKETQGAYDYGTLCHSYILEPESVLADFNFYEGFRKAGKEFEDFKLTAKPGLPIISNSQHVQVKELIKAYDSHPVAPSLISGGHPEYTICGTLHGVPIKVRTDYINIDKGYIADVKTTSYPSDKDSFTQTVDGLSYHLSAALYCAMAEQFYGKKFDFFFVVLSKRNKTCDVFRLSDEKMELGKRMVSEACSKYKKALASGIWTEAAFTEPEEKLQTDYVIEEI